MRRINMVGQTYGRLTVIEESGKMVQASCACGSSKWYFRTNVLAGYTQSCGCLRNERTKESCQTHGHKPGAGASPTYTSWLNMWKRCTNPAYHAYARYGGRGISVAPEWKDFAVFLEDMGERPNGMELDRIDNNGDYEAGNCRWTTHKENVNNRG